MIFERLVTLNGTIQIEGPRGDFVFGENGVPVFKDALRVNDVVQVITISNPPTPRRIFVSMSKSDDPNTQWAERVLHSYECVLVEVDG